ncbi:MAG: flagellar protein FlaG [Pseudomonadota bacterium]
MIIQSVNANHDVLPIRLVAKDAPVVVAESKTQAVVLQPPTSEQLKTAVDSINKAMQQSNHSLEFSVDSYTKKPVVKMIDTETGKVITQFPSEEVLAIAQSIDEFLSQHQFKQGALFKQTA